MNSWDGSDYPSGLRGNVIPLGSRIFAVADAFDAMTSDRSYLVALPIREACGESSVAQELNSMLKFLRHS